MAGLDTMAGVIVEGPMNAAELLTVQLVENALREDLRPLEQAKAFRALMQQRDWSARQLARELAIPHPNVVRALALLELPPSVQDSVEQGALPPATAYEVSKLPTAEAQAEVAGLVVAEGLSRAQAVDVVRRRSRPAGKGRGPARARKVTTRTARTSAGYKVTVEFRRGIEPAIAAAALRELADRWEAEAARESAAA